MLRAQGVLASLLDNAVKAHQLAQNPAKGVELPRKTPQNQTRVFNHATAARFG